LPNDTPKLQKLAAKTVHYGIYICLAAIPISGLMIALVFWLDFKSEFLIETIAVFVKGVVRRFHAASLI
jgi:cytochrome b561